MNRKIRLFMAWASNLAFAGVVLFGPILAASQSDSGSEIVGGAFIPSDQGNTEASNPAPPPALKPIQTSPDREELPPLREDTDETPVLTIRENPPPRIKPPSSVLREDSPSVIESVRVQVEYSPVGADYRVGQPDGGRLEAGERMRWKYPSDLEWRVLKAFGSTQVQLEDHHYKVGGDFFHSFREGNQRIQVPKLEEAWQRENNPKAVLPDQSPVKLFVQVDSSAPKAPPPDGNCAVWEKGNLLLSDRVSGEIDSVVGGKIKNLQVTSYGPGMIFGLQPPSKVFAYAVKVDFEQQIFANLGREKGRSDSELEEANRLLQVADTSSRVEWAQGRIAYEQARGAYLEEQKQYYDMFLRGDLDSITLIRSQHPIPHVQFADIVYRHENLEISAGLFSDHTGKVLIPADAFLWINEAAPVQGSPFEFEIVDKSDPPFIGYDTRFRSEGSEMIVEERPSGGAGWTPRDLTFDTYVYATFTPPQAGLPPEYVVDLTEDMTGGLKRLDQEMIVNGRIGTIRLTENDFRIDLNPELLISPIPMNDLLRNILIGPFDLRSWIFGRRSRIQQAFMKVHMIPDPVLDPFEEMVDELALKAYRIEKEKRTRNSTFQFKPALMVLKLSRTPNPGNFLAEISIEDEDLNTASVARSINPGVDLIDYLARSVALNREETDLAEIRPLALSEWRSLVQGGPGNP
ncbi:MAG: hypothetical protein KC994_03040 [Candidatus Omnitrophica bacterium]|nr:hypothetical protein [Candidatus Omnitrophota bacterium]